jgi:adenine specific DNA methylase Mod
MQKMNSTIFGSVKNRKISYHKNVKKILVKYNQQLKFVSNTANFIKLWSKAKYAIVPLLLTHLNYKNNSPTSTGSLVIENRGVFFYNATS